MQTKSALALAALAASFLALCYFQLAPYLPSAA